MKFNPVPQILDVYPFGYPFLTQLHLTLKIKVLQPADFTFLSSKYINKLESHLFLTS